MCDYKTNLQNNRNIIGMDKGSKYVISMCEFMEIDHFFKWVLVLVESYDVRPRTAQDMQMMCCSERM